MKNNKGFIFGPIIDTLALGVVVLVVVVCIVVAAINYEPKKMYFEKQLRPTEQIEEILEDRIEAENPDFDFEVNITRETED